MSMMYTGTKFSQVYLFFLFFIIFVPIHRLCVLVRNVLNKKTRSRRNSSTDFFSQFKNIHILYGHVHIFGFMSAFLGKFVLWIIMLKC